MMRRMLVIIGVLLLAIPAVAGTWTSNSFLYKPSTGARGEAEKNTFDSGLDRVDVRLGKEIWVGDPNYGATLPAAVTAIGNHQALLRIPAGTWIVGANLTIPANITLRPERGAILNVTTGVTLTINGGLEAGLYQIFLCAGTGKVVFGSFVSKVYHEWWGAKADGSTDCLIPMQQCFDALYQTSTAKIYLTGSYLVSDTLTLGSGSHYATVVLCGSSPGLFWDNGAGYTPCSELRASSELTNKPLLKISSHRVILEKICLRGAGTLTESSYGPGSNGTIGLEIAIASEYTTLRDVTIQLFDIGIFIGNNDGSQGGCAENHLYEVGINHCTYCIQSDNSQAFSLNLHSCTFGSRTHYGFKALDIGGYSGNTLQIFGGDFGCDDTVFKLGSQAYGNTYISGAHFEAGTEGSDPPTLIEANYPGGANIIPITFIGNVINYGYHPWYSTTKPLINITGNFFGLLSFIGNTCNECNPIIVCGSGGAAGLGVQQDHFRFKDNFWYYAPDLTNAKNLTTEGDIYLKHNMKKVGGVESTSDIRIVPYARTPNSGSSRGPGIIKIFGGFSDLEGYFQAGTLVFGTPSGPGQSMGWMVTTTGFNIIGLVGNINQNSNILTGVTYQYFEIGDSIKVAGAGPGGADLTSTITAINPDTGEITLADNASTTVTGATVTGLPAAVFTPMANLP